EIEWFKDGKLNAAYNAVDRHLKTWRKNKVALYWEGENGESEKYTFEDLAEKSNQFAHGLKSLGIKRGERVFIFLPRIPELYIAFLGILKTGAIAGTLFSAFQEQALFDRLENSGAKVLVTNKNLLPRVEKIRKKLKNLRTIIVVDRSEGGEGSGGSEAPPRGSSPEGLCPAGDKKRQGVKDFYELCDGPVNFPIAKMAPEDDAFMLYTSGTTGKPKGVVHRHLAVLYEHLTAKWVLDLHDDDTYWCTADPGWVTGIAYEILGSWSNGVAAVVYEGRFSPEKWYEILDKYRVTVWYTAPTAIRLLAAARTDIVKKYNLSFLRHLCSVGEPLNPEPIRWGIKALGLPFHDNWWQTETGGICIANYPSMDIKLGSMGKPVPGIKAEILNDNGEILPEKQIGSLALRPDWPGLMKKIWKRPHKYKSYFLPAGRQGKKGMACHERAKRVEWYISGDLAYKDEEGYFWFVGRADDVIKTSGERVGPFEVESALVEHPAVIEAGVIGKPDPIRGEVIKAFVVVKENQKAKIKDQKYSEQLSKELMDYVKTHLAGHAYPREIEFVEKLPKTRSGKIMRRVLKAKELGLPIGDLSTLEEY
ncbi:MAG: AMP-binding protein, partial [bacterium]|nr:AMP-binding protein [bacterium]